MTDLSQLQELLAGSENNGTSNNKTTNEAFLNIYLVQGDIKLQLAGIGLNQASESKFNSKNQKALFTKLLETSRKLDIGAKKVILDTKVIQLELLRTGKEASIEVTSTLLDLLEI